jgi:hypothetical protein
MWEPNLLTTLRAFTASYMDSFRAYKIYIYMYREREREERERRERILDYRSGGSGFDSRQCQVF